MDFNRNARITKEQKQNHIITKQPKNSAQNLRIICIQNKQNAKFQNRVLTLKRQTQNYKSKNIHKHIYTHKHTHD